MKIYYVKQKLMGLAVLILSFLFLDVLIEYEAVISLALSIPGATCLLEENEKKLQKLYAEREWFEDEYYCPMDLIDISNVIIINGSIKGNKL